MIAVGREELPPLAAERRARAIWGDDPAVTLALPGDYGREPRRHDLRHGTAPAVSVRAHVDPRVQSVVEISRERAMGQAADRLRLIHRDPTRPARVLVLSNLPVPGLVVDRLMTLDDTLAGGTAIERALARMAGGVLPLAAEWLMANLPELFPSLRTTRRLVADLKVPLGNRYLYCRLALYRMAGQKRPSKALVTAGAADPRAELGRLLGADIAEFRMAEAEPDATPAAEVRRGRPPATAARAGTNEAPAPADAPVPPAVVTVLGELAPWPDDVAPRPPPPTPAPPPLDLLAPGARARLKAMTHRLELARPPLIWGDGLDRMKEDSWRERMRSREIARLAASPNDRRSQKRIPAPQTHSTPADIYPVAEHLDPPLAGEWHIQGTETRILDRLGAGMPEHRFSRLMWVEPAGAVSESAPVAFAVLTGKEEFCVRPQAVGAS